MTDLSGYANALVEITPLGGTLKKRAADVLAYFDRPGTSNGPTEALNGRLEHLPRFRTRVPQPHELHGDEFVAAVHETGENGGASVWPDVSPAECGYRLQLVYLDESLRGMESPTRRVCITGGQICAE